MGRVVRRRNGGFSILEVVIVLALMSLVALIALTGSQKVSTRTRGADALARVVADHLRTARAKASASAIPTAVVFPSSGGTVPFSQSCGLVSGIARGRVQRVFDFSGDFPGSCIFVGRTGAAGETLARSTVGDKLDGFTSNRWYDAADFQFIFTPSGTVTSNNLPLIEGRYFLVVCSGVQYTSASPPSGPAETLNPQPGYFQLSGVQDPHTIWVSAESGQVECSPGLPGGVAIAEVGGGWLGSPAPSLELDSLSGGVPVVTALDVLPLEAIPANLPPDLDGVVRDGETLTFRLSVEDDQDRPMTYKMSAIRESDSQEVNGFAASGQQSLTFERSQRRWVGSATWSPPPGDLPGTHYTIDARITTSDGASTLASASIEKPRIEKRRGGKFLISGTGYTAVVNDDGSQFRFLNRLNYTNPRFTPDGTSLVCSPSSAYNPAGTTLIYSSVDGKIVRNVSSPFTYSWDPVQGGGSVVIGGLKMMDVSTGLVTPISYPPSSYQGAPSAFNFPPMGGKVFYMRTDNSYSEEPTGSLYIADWNPSAATISDEQWVPGAGGGHMPGYVSGRMAPKGNRVFVQDFSLGGSLGAVTIYKTTSPYLETSRHFGGTYRPLAWSPEGDRIAGYNTGQRTVIIHSVSNINGVGEQIDLSPFLPAAIGTLDWGK